MHSTACTSTFTPDRNLAASLQKQPSGGPQSPTTALQTAHSIHPLVLPLMALRMYMLLTHGTTAFRSLTHKAHSSHTLALQRPIMALELALFGAPMARPLMALATSTSVTPSTTACRSLTQVETTSHTLALRRPAAAYTMAHSITQRALPLIAMATYTLPTQATTACRSLTHRATSSHTLAPHRPIPAH